MPSVYRWIISRATDGIFCLDNNLLHRQLFIRFRIGNGGSGNRRLFQPFFQIGKV